MKTNITHCKCRWCDYVVPFDEYGMIFAPAHLMAAHNIGKNPYYFRTPDLGANFTMIREYPDANH